MKPMMKASSCLVLFLAMSLPAMAQTYDLVIHNGRVMYPETMLDAKLNVGVEDGRIAVITKDKITGEETIDDTGLVVSPGVQLPFNPALNPDEDLVTGCGDRRERWTYGC